MTISPGTRYFSLKQMAQINRGAQIEESDDERIGVNQEIKEEDDEFSTYFSENRVQIPENDNVSRRLMCHTKLSIRSLKVTDSNQCDRIFSYKM